jgi:hypothetical protein
VIEEVAKSLAIQNMEWGRSMDGLEQDAPVTMKMWAGCPRLLEDTGGPPNTVSLHNNHGSLTNSRHRLACELSRHEFGSGLGLDRALCAPTSTALDLCGANVREHLRKHSRSCLRGKCSGRVLFAWL